MASPTYRSPRDGVRLRIITVKPRHVPALEAIEIRSDTVPNERISWHIEIQRVSSIFIAAQALPPDERAGGGLRAVRSRLQPLLRIPFQITRRRKQGEMAGFAGISLRTTPPEVIAITTDPAWRRRGVAELLMLHTIAIARARRAARVALEGRKTNTPAQALYRKHGSEPQRVLPSHYTDNNEDAILMHTPPLDDARYRQHLDLLHEQLKGRWEPL